MKRYFLFLLFSVSFFWALAQNNGKPNLDTSMFNKWPSPGRPIISNDGSFIFYNIYNVPLGNRTLIVQSVNGNWRKEFLGVVESDARFSSDSKKLFLKLRNDSLYMVSLGKGEKSFIARVTSFELRFKKGGDWLAYKLKSSIGELVTHDLGSNKRHFFSSVIHYSFIADGEGILIQRRIQRNAATIVGFEWIKLSEHKVNSIWEGSNVDCYTLSEDETQLTFIGNNSGKRSLWYYKFGMSKSVLKFSDEITTVDTSLVLSNRQPEFSKEGNLIFFYCHRKENRFTKRGLSSVDIWSYKDLVLQSKQLNQLAVVPEFCSVININDDKVINLEEENEKLIRSTFSILTTRGDEYVLVHLLEGSQYEYSWNLYLRSVVYLVSTKNGKRKVLAERIDPMRINYSISPNGDYIIYYNSEKKDFFTYNINNGVWVNVTEKIRVPSFAGERSVSDTVRFHSLVEWLPRINDFFIYDQFDIWQVDPTGRTLPKNITQGVGRRNNMAFRIMRNDYNEPHLLRHTQKWSLLLAAFNLESKDNGFYRLQIGGNFDPVKLTIGPFIYYWPEITIFNPRKAKNSDIWIVQRMSSSDCPNYFITNDFITFSPVIRIQPHRSYNWLSAHLIKWKTFNGVLNEGVLYKPENFDPKKKYPIIFNIYEKGSAKLNVYLNPEFSSGQLNIPYFVSNGYLVFVPDINYEIGNPGESVYNCVVSAAKYLFTLPWIDSSKVGIQGHSFGAYEINYLISHTNIFTAAAEASGVSDLVSWYGSLRLGGESSQWSTEFGQNRIGATLWERPDLYVKNSPIFSADKVYTPLLMMHNKKDDNVSWLQGVELFLSLRRLGKVVWMLQYDYSGHQPTGMDAVDFTKRLCQFFDHYLKGSPPAKWMRENIPARLKGIEDGLN